MTDETTTTSACVITPEEIDELAAYAYHVGAASKSKQRVYVEAQASAEAALDEMRRVLKEKL